MTVQELIKELEEFDPTLKVYYSDFEFGPTLVDDVYIELDDYGIEVPFVRLS